MDRFHIHISEKGLFERVWNTCLSVSVLFCRGLQEDSLHQSFEVHCGEAAGCSGRGSN